MVDLAGSGRLKAIAGITLLGLALRVAGLGQSLYGDELYTYRALVDHGLGDALRSVYRTEDTPPLFFVLAWAAAKAGDPTLWLRVPSLVLGTAAIPLTYLIGLRTVGRSGALIGAALLALAPFAVFYAGEARAYATLVFFVALSTLALLRVVDGRPSPLVARAGRRRRCGADDALHGALRRRRAGAAGRSGARPRCAGGCWSRTRWRRCRSCCCWSRAPRRAWARSPPCSP